MRPKRRMATVTAVVAIAALALTACSSNSNNSSGQTTGAAGTGSGNGRTLDVFLGAQPNYPDQFKQWSTDITAKFKAATGADLTIETYASSADETTKIQASIVAGSGPDVYQLGTTFTPVAYGTKGFVVLSDDDWNEIGGQAQFVPTTLGMSGPDPSTQIGIPVAMRPFVMAYNTDMFKAAGITTPPTTWDALVADAKKLTNGSAYGMAIGLRGRLRSVEVHLVVDRAGGRLLRQRRPQDGPTQLADVNKATRPVLRLPDQVQSGRPGQRRLEGRRRHRRVRQGKAAIFPMAAAASIPTPGQVADEGQVRLRPTALVAAGHDRPGRRERRPPRPSCPATTWPSLRIRRTRIWRSPTSTSITSADMQAEQYDLLRQPAHQRGRASQLTTKNPKLDAAVPRSPRRRSPPRHSPAPGRTSRTA